jgi:hypothetical protein
MVFDIEAAEAVRNLVLAERAAKDLGAWDDMAATFSDDAAVRVSWFQGRAADFVAASRERHKSGGASSFHEIGAIHVDLCASRAVAHATCAVHLRGAVSDGPGAITVDVASRGRIYWRVERREGWRIAGLDMIYFRDTIAPADPSRTIGAAVGRAAEGYRSSYRWISLLLGQKGHAIDPELPGVDRPDLVDAFLEQQREWLTAR